jgi:hypothetical protein
LSLSIIFQICDNEDPVAHVIKGFFNSQMGTPSRFLVCLGYTLEFVFSLV